MNIGLLAYNAVCNFGANLQLLSTVEYIKKTGNIPYVINWVPYSLEKGILRRPIAQQEAHIDFRRNYFNETKLCRTSEDIANVIRENNIEAVIIGSDAIAQHHPLLSRIHFPDRRIISIRRVTEDRMFPNPFWGTFNDYLDHKIPIAIISASCQNSSYKLFPKTVVKDMYKYASRYSYLSTRDDWTRDMYCFLSKGQLKPSVTPDPVFGFNYNVSFIPSKEEITQKFHLNEKYILFSFYNNRRLNVEWLSNFEKQANAKGLQCVAMAFPEGICFNHPFEKKIDNPLSPLDWYALIKYSSGYIGHNMHPIVVSLHNSVPFFSFDNYGITKLGIFVNEKSSKIYHILNLSGFLLNRFNDKNLLAKRPDVELVLDKIVNFDKDKCSQFSHSYYELYKKMMSDTMISILRQ